MRKELIDYGYLWLGMQKISYAYAKSLLQDKKPKEVCLLYEDNTENYINEDDNALEELENHYNNGGLIGIPLDRYNEYVVFILGRDLLKDILPFENDIAYEYCVNIAKDFEISDYNTSRKGVYTCLEEYVNNNFIKDRKGNWTFKGKDIYNVCGGVR